MDTKLKSMTNRRKNTLRNIAMFITVTTTIVLIAVILLKELYRYDYNLTVVAFILAVLAIIQIVNAIFIAFDNTYILLEYEKYYKKLKKRALIYQIIPLAYIFLILTILCKGKTIYGDTFIDEMLLYNAELMIVLILFIPVIFFELTLILCVFKRQEKLILNMKNVTEQAVEESSKSEKMKIDLITNISHDLKTPLTSVVGYIELMKKEEMTEILRDYVDVISIRTGILKDMIEKLFDLAKASSGNIKLNKEILDMNIMIKQIVADLDDIIKEKGRDVEFNLTEQPVKFIADNSYVYRIFQNVFENALKYSMDGTRIFVKTENIEKKVVFEIVNIANYHMDFDKETIKGKFVRADKSRTTEGNGLGLAIVDTYTKLFDGEFDIKVEGDIFRAIISFKQFENK